jgi:hypothetical protein
VDLRLTQDLLAAGRLNISPAGVLGRRATAYVPPNGTSGTVSGRSIEAANEKFKDRQQRQQKIQQGGGGDDDSEDNNDDDYSDDDNDDNDASSVTRNLTAPSLLQSKSIKYVTMIQ